MYNDGYGYNKIIKELNLQGFRTKKNSKFGKGSLGTILKNEKYTGVYVFNRANSKDVDGKRNGRDKDDEYIIKVEGAVPPIISKEEFQSTGKRMPKIVLILVTQQRSIFIIWENCCGECGELILVTEKCGRE